MSNRDHNKWILLIKSIEGVLGNHIGDQEQEIDAADDRHRAEAVDGSFHSPTLTGSGLLVTDFATFIEGRPEN